MRYTTFMVKTNKSVPKESQTPIAAVSIIGLSPIIVGVLFIGDSLHITDAALLSILLILAALSISIFLPKNRNNNYRYVTPAIILASINILLILDFWNETTTKNDSCGAGFFAGNCFLFDGIGVMFYFYIIPVLLIISTLLLTSNLAGKAKQK